MDVYNHVERINFEIGSIYKCLMFDRHTEYYTHLPPTQGVALLNTIDKVSKI